MNATKAKKLHSEFKEVNKKKALIFAKRINFAKGYQVI
jgi:hypothetical protein